MRPHRLRLQALGPFAGELDLDFDELSEQGTFVIAGETGTGKTAVFDAMSFGLFGEASGNERDARELRSDFSTPETATWVVLEFSVGPRRYRVRRSPSYARPKLRGDGTTEQAATALLWDTTGDGDGVGQLLATRPTEVNERIRELLRLDARQYRQTGILPQGEFRKVITGDAKERERILRQLFDTWRYQAVQDQLKRERSKLLEALGKSKVQVDTIRRGAGVASAEELDEAIEECGKELRGTELDHERLRKERDGADAALDTGRAAQKLLDNKRVAKEALYALELQRAEIDEASKELDAARRALALADLDEQRTSRAAEAKRARDELGGKDVAVEGGREHAELKKEALRERNDEAQRRDELAEDVLRLQELRKVGLDAAAEAARLAGVTHDAALDEAKTAKAALTTAGLAETEAKRTLDADSKLAEDLDDARVRRERAAAAVVDRKRRDELGAAIQSTSKELETAKETLRIACEGAESARQKLDELRETRLLALAASLAEGLVDGEGCPVCGAVDHPEPAAHDDDGPTVARIEEARTKARNADEAAKKADESRDGLVKKLALLEGELRGIADREQDPVELEEALKQARENEKACQDASEREPRSKSALGVATKEREKAHAAAVAADGKVHAAASKLASARGVLEERCARVPEALRDEGALETVLEASKTTLHALREGMETARSEHQDAERDLAAREAAAKAAKGASELADGRLDEARRRFSDRRAAEGFPTDADYVAAKRGEAQRSTLSEQISTWKKDQAAAEGQSLEADRAAEGVEAPDLEQLEKAYGEAKESADLCAKRLGELGKTLESKEAQAAELAKAEGLYQEREAEHRVVARLADVAGGNNGARLPFERYVMAAILDEVLVDANQRLHVMTGGRFVLSRRESTRGRAKAGLDLDVLDHYTGKKRRASTLSGGEGFEAALSLALGLADTVQAQSGGMHLGSLFIDEGFGSLGSEDLDRVLRALEDLGQGRMIGIVSHVAELRERLPVALELEKTPEGSRMKD